MSNKTAKRINIGWYVSLSRQKGPCRYQNKGRNSLEMIVRLEKIFATKLYKQLRRQMANSVP